MTIPYILDVGGIGPVLFRRSRRARRIILSIRPFRGVAVSVPRGVSFDKAEEFLFLKLDWIKKHMEKMKRYEKDRTVPHNETSLIATAAAKGILTRRLDELANKHGFAYGKVTVRCQRTRWGSCSHRNNISLNIKAAELPQELIDYLILHELVHTRIHNHSRQFWAELDKYVGDARSLSKILRKRCL